PPPMALCVFRNTPASHPAWRKPLRRGGTEEAEVARKPFCYTPVLRALLIPRDGSRLTITAHPTETSGNFGGKPEVAELVRIPSTPSFSLLFLRSSLFQRFWPPSPDSSASNHSVSKRAEVSVATRRQLISIIRLGSKRVVLHPQPRQPIIPQLSCIAGAIGNPVNPAL